MNTWPSEVFKMPTAEVMAAVSMTNANAGPRPSRRLRAYFLVSGLAPPSSKASVFSNIRTMPVNESSNWSIGTLTCPRAGSFISAYLPLNPRSTTKWLKFQKIMQGKGSFFFNTWVDMVMPLAARP